MKKSTKDNSTKDRIGAFVVLGLGFAVAGTIGVGAIASTPAEKAPVEQSVHSVFKMDPSWQQSDLGQVGNVPQKAGNVPGK